MKRISIYLALSALFIVSCIREPRNYVQDSGITVFPDYTGITVPANIAPLNFMIQEPGSNYLTILESGNTKIRVKGRKVSIPMHKWKNLTAQGDIKVQVFVRKDNGWSSMPTFSIFVAEEIDPYLTYRVLPPLFESYQRLTINQRDLTSFHEKVVYANSMASSGDRLQCINCHSFKNWKTDNMQFHIRQYLGGTILYTNGKLNKLNLKTDSTISAAVYPSWHPTHDYIAYSTNRTFQNLHINHADRIEVFDEESDLILFNLADNAVSIIENDSTEYECYPSWSNDGRRLFYVSANMGNPTEFRKHGGAAAANANATFKYNLYYKDFNPDDRTWGPKVLYYDAAARDSSITWPRMSPDGRWLICCISTRGVFPPNQYVSDLMLFDMQKGTHRYLDEVNSDFAESYHSWSSNGRWIVISSKREDNVYTRLYLAHMNNDGTFSKPFLIPQKDPEHSHKFLYSYNIPEFTVEPVRISAKEIASFVKGTDAKPVNFEQKRGE